MSEKKPAGSRQWPQIPGAILADALYTLDEAAARLGWGGHAFRAARANGLKVHRCGKRGYVTGSELIAFITKRGDVGNSSAADRLKKIEDALAMVLDALASGGITNGGGT